MLDIAWPELMVIGVVALVAIPPKDLPKVMHALGRMAGKLRAFGQELQRSFDQLSYESEITEKLKQNSEPAPAEAPANPPPPAPSEAQAEHDHRTAP
jgi:sec-independent protein translocase protein TatB